MDRRNTIQKELVLNAVVTMHRHVTADEVYDFIRNAYPTIAKGTVYRNLGILAEENRIRKIEIPDGPDRYDFTLKRHYHVRCVKCGSVSDVDMEEIRDFDSLIRDRHGMEFLDYDILFTGICEACREKERIYG